MEPRPFDQLWDRGRMSLSGRVTRLRSKTWAIAQCSLAAGVAWFVAADVFGHQTPFFAPIAAVVSLGTSYGQRLRRVAEVTIGVAVGVLIADLLVVQIGSGAWQLVLIVALAMSAAFLLDGGQLLVTQAAVQSIVVATLIPEVDAAFIRWTDALIGGAVALVAATVVPAAPLRRPREQAAEVVRKIAELLRRRGRPDGLRGRRPGAGAAGRRPGHRLPDPRAAGRLGGGAFGGGVVALPGPAPRRPAPDGRPRRPAGPGAAQHPGAGPAHRRRGLPAAADPGLLRDARPGARRGDRRRSPTSSPRTRWPSAPGSRCVAVGHATGSVERSTVLSAEVVLAQLRSVVADLLLVTGMDELEATDALPAAALMSVSPS